MRWFLSAALVFCLPSFATSPCLDHLRDYATRDPILQATLSKMAGRWARNEEWISYYAAAILGTRTTTPLGSYAARIPRQKKPLEMEELAAMDRLMDEGVQFELDDLYLGVFSNTSMRAQLRGDKPSRAAVMGLFPTPVRQGDAVTWLQRNPELAQVPRSVLAQPDAPIFEPLQSQTTSIHFGGRAQPWGNFRPLPEGDQYRLVVYGTHLDRLLAPIIGLIARQLFEAPQLRHLRVEVPAKLAYVGDPESFDITGTTSLHDFGPRELGERCDELARALATVLGARTVESGIEYTIRLQNDRTVSLVFVP